MKKITLTLLLVMGMLVPSLSVHAQNAIVQFTYDACGNRILRSLLISKVEENGKRVENENGYQDTMTEQVGEITISLFPNPTEGRVSVLLSENTYTYIDALLTTTTGTVLEQYRFNDIQHEFDLSSQPAGIYFLRLTMDGETRTWKIVKQ